MSKADFRMDADWEARLFRQAGTKALVAAPARRIAGYTKDSAPRRRASKPHWNEIRRHIEVSLSTGEQGWRACVVVEADPRVRHALLLERGFTAGGRRFEGRHYVKAALMKARVE